MSTPDHRRRASTDLRAAAVCLEEAAQLLRLLDEASQATDVESVREWLLALSKRVEDA